MNSTHTCRRCGYISNAVGNVTGRSMPKEGDVALCLKCGDASVFNEDGERRDPTPEELLEFEHDEQLQNVRMLIKKMTLQ